jgi:hypothetical protein
MSMRKTRNIILIALLALCAACKNAQLREPGEPVDLPLDDLDAAAVVDGGEGDGIHAQASDGGQEYEGDGGQEHEGAASGEPGHAEDQLGIDLREP